MFQISHLVKEFNSVPAVNDVTTNIDRGEVVFIVGPVRVPVKVPSCAA